MKTPITGTTFPVAFTPANGAGLVFSATTTSSTQAFVAGDGSNGISGTNCGNVLFYNAGTDLVFVRVGVGSQTATNADTPIASGAYLLLSKFDATYAAVIANASTAMVYVMPGEGQF